MKLRRTPASKIDYFRRKLVKIAKSNAQAAIAQALRASHRGGSSLGQRPATLFIMVSRLDSEGAAVQALRPPCWGGAGRRRRVGWGGLSVREVRGEGRGGVL